MTALPLTGSKFHLFHCVSAVSGEVVHSNREIHIKRKVVEAMAETFLAGLTCVSAIRRSVADGAGTCSAVEMTADKEPGTI